MTYLTSSPVTRLSRSLHLALAVGALAFAGARVHAADADSLDPVQLDEITVSAPSAKTVGRDPATGGPIQQVTVTARVHADPASLKTEYGVLMLQDSVRDAAHKVCTEVDPLSEDDGTCFQQAMDGAKPQVDAAIARARSTNKT
jgi:UrcA family protein